MNLWIHTGVKEFEHYLLNLEIGCEFHQDKKLLVYVQSVLGNIRGIANTPTYHDFNSLLDMETSTIEIDPNNEYHPAILLINVDRKNE